MLSLWCEAPSERQLVYIITVLSRIDPEAPDSGMALRAVIMLLNCPAYHWSIWTRPGARACDMSWWPVEMLIQGKLMLFSLLAQKNVTMFVNPQATAWTMMLCIIEP